LLHYSGIPPEGSERVGQNSVSGLGGVLPPMDNTYYYTLPASASRLAGCYNPGPATPPSNAAGPSTTTIWSLARMTSLQQAAAVPGADSAAFLPTSPPLQNGNPVDLQVKVRKGGKGGSAKYLSYSGLQG